MAVMSFDGAGIGGRDAAGRLVAGLLVAAVAGVGGCASGADAPDGSPASSPEPSVSTPAASAGLRPLMAYPEMPSVAWTFAAEDAGLVAEVGELILFDPTRITPVGEGSVPPSLIDAGATVVIAVHDFAWPPVARPYVLVGIDADSGEPRWTFEPDDGDVTGCAGDLLDGHLACSVRDGDGQDQRAGIVLVDVITGAEVGRFALPADPGLITVSGSRLFALSETRQQSRPEGAQLRYELGAYEASGEQLWATELVFTPLDRGASFAIDVGEALIGVDIHGSSFVLAADDGAVVLQHEGFGFWRLTDDGGLLIGRETPEGGWSFNLVGADGSEVADMSGFGVLGDVFDDGGVVHLLDEQGQVVLLDAATGATAGTGVTPGATPAPTGYVATPAVSAWDGMLVVWSFGPPDSMRGYSLADPAQPAWEREVERINVGDGRHSALTDGTVLYTGVATADDDQAAGTPTASFAAVNVADGSLAWTLSVQDEPGPWGSWGSGFTLTSGGGRLIVIDDTKMTALAP